jgi:hypothetical protein
MPLAEALAHLAKPRGLGSDQDDRRAREEGGIQIPLFRLKESTVKEYPDRGRLSHERIVIVQGANR